MNVSTRRLTVALLVALAAAVPYAQQQPPTPTFRSGIDVTPIDVTVITSSGSPIPDLKPADFRVRVDGREDCAFCGTDLDAAEAEHEANVTEMRRAAQALRDALARDPAGPAPRP